MKTQNLDKLYIQLDRHIRLVEAHLEIKGLSSVIKAIRLKPYSYFFTEKTDKLVLFNKWFDEFGNTLEINKKKIYIKYNDLSLDHNKIISTDLYYGLAINQIVKMSKLAYLIVGKDEDLYQDCYVLTLLGIDNYLRTYVYMYDQWNQVASLLLEIETLITIMHNSDITYFRELDNKEKLPVPCVPTKTWLVSLPASVSFLSQIKDYNKLTIIFSSSSSSK